MVWTDADIDSVLTLCLLRMVHGLVLCENLLVAVESWQFALWQDQGREQTVAH